jgi:hypothetical protein
MVFPQMPIRASNKFVTMLSAEKALAFSAACVALKKQQHRKAITSAIAKPDRFASRGELNLRWQPSGRL